METLHLVLNAVTVIFIAATMFAAGLGGPFGAKLAMVQSGDVFAGAAMQVLLAAIGSVTFAPTVNGLLTAADAGTNVSLDVGALVRTVALLQLVPFAIGLLIRRYAEPTARSWHPTAAAVSNVTFLIVLAGMLLGSGAHAYGAGTSVRGLSVVQIAEPAQGGQARQEAVLAAPRDDEARQ
ncbi:hypothetical protein [Streptomyces sp. NPDC051452]|uniref:hypothetical protein n=1 Tax=Streptomyces sp. NPDC051452 TaxID=3365654 RepID=UPI003798E7CD